MSSEELHNAQLETDGTKPPLVRVEGVSVPRALSRIQTLRAVVPLTWALPPHVYADEVVNLADRLLTAYYAADPDEYWTKGSSDAYVCYQGSRFWLFVTPESKEMRTAIYGLSKQVLKSRVAYGAWRVITWCLVR